MQHKEQRVLVLFDVQNLYYSAKHLYNKKVNFRALLNEAVAKRKLVRAIAYVIKTDIKEESNFHEALNNIGIEVKSKDLQVFNGGAKKGDWDIGIAMDAVRMASKIDTLVLVSGDGDFKDLLYYMKSHGCRTEVLALGKTASKMIRDEADLFYDIESNINKFLIGNQSKTKAGSSTNNTSKKSTQKKTTEKKTTKKTKSTPKDNSQLEMVSSNLSKQKKSSYGSGQNDNKQEDSKEDEKEKNGFADKLKKLLSE
ncbi:MAG: NYN domain-containing protein [Nanobdellota archaeon]